MKLEGLIRFVIFKQVLDELEAKRKREPNANKFIQQLNAGLSYIDKNKENYEIDFNKDVKTKNESTDEFILRRSIELKNEGYNIYIATNDFELRKKAKLLKISSICLRQKKFLSIDKA